MFLNFEYYSLHLNYAASAEDTLAGNNYGQIVYLDFN